MQQCYSCHKDIVDGSIIHIKCVAILKQVPGDVMHGINILEELEIVHEQCDED